MTELLAGAAIFAVDQAGKYKAEEDPAFLGRRPGGRVEITKTHNKGFAMNLGEGNPKRVTAVCCGAGVLTAVLAACAWKSLGKGGRLGLTLALGGAASNVFDRLKRGYVVDYISFPKLPKKISRISFNLGDFGILAGVVLTLLKS